MKTFRFSVNCKNVYQFIGSKFVTFLASYKNEAAGFIREDRLRELLDDLNGYEYTNLRLVDSNEYFKNN